MQPLNLSVKRLDLSDVDIIPWSKVMGEENEHVEVDFETTTSGTKHINCCNESMDFFI